MAKISDFRQKEVVNINDGKRLGYVCDIDLNLETGTVNALILPPERLFGLIGKSSEVIIPWDKIAKIGNDIILVDYNGA